MNDQDIERLVVGWEPYKKGRKILIRAMEHINSVNYAVSVRWVFYRLLQDGLYSKKSHYNNFVSLTSRARHSFWNGWHPLILADETRDIIISETSGDEPDPDIDSLIEGAKEQAQEEREYLLDAYENYQYSCDYTVDPNCYQDDILIVMYEARAMTAQFKQYIPDGISLCPFGGQPSIPYKYRISEYIDRLSGKYGKDVVVLYFGDLDNAGLVIYDTAIEHITGWSRSNPEFVRCGLTEEQVEKYGIPENPDHPGYQWEALTDAQASEIIHDALSQYYNFKASKQAEEESARIEQVVDEAVNDQGGEDD